MNKVIKVGAKVAILAHIRGGLVVQGGLDDSADEGPFAANCSPAAPDLHGEAAGEEAAEASIAIDLIR